MAAARLLRMYRPLGLGQPCYSSSNINGVSTLLSKSVKVSCISKQGFNGETRPTGDGSDRQRQPAAKAVSPASESVIIARETKVDKGVVDLALLLGNVVHVVIEGLKFVSKRRRWSLYIQMFVEKAMIDCRFFTLFAVAGSCLGSILCFAEGCFLVVESYLQYLNVLAQRTDHGRIMQLLIEAIDMFLVGTAILTFGMSLYVMFVGSKEQSQFEFSHVKVLPSRGGLQSVMQAKSKIGQAVLMLLQVGILEKFKSIPLVNGLDLACFAGAVFVSSASTFLLSKLTVDGTTTHS